MNEKKEVWEEYKNKILSNQYEPKRHNHLDPFFSFKDDFQQIEQIIFTKGDKIDSLHGFSFLPLLKTVTKTPRFKYLEELKDYKLSTKKRPIFLTAHKDKYIYGFYSYYLNFLYQKKLSKTKFKNSPIAYRSDLNGKCNIQFSKEVFDYVKRLKNCVTILTDVSSFFDNINHDILKKNWSKILEKDRLPPDHFKIFKALTNYRYVGMTSLLKKFNITLDNVQKNNGSLLSYIKEKGKLNDKLKLLNHLDLIVKNKANQNGELKGIPQGLSISAVLSNIYLWDIDEILNEYATSKNKQFRIIL